MKKQAIQISATDNQPLSGGKVAREEKALKKYLKIIIPIVVILALAVPSIAMAAVLHSGSNGAAGTGKIANAVSGGFVDNNGDGICDNYTNDTAQGATASLSTSKCYVDNNGDGICDNYASGTCNGGGYADGNGDGICDNYHANHGSTGNQNTGKTTGQSNAHHQKSGHDNSSEHH
ncbi:MAG: hypothetical protein LBH87_02000 [Coriobacteriales bacterium]|jgi:hypothetical protein|nr:hypothetical protein [Coriobacteriales bacterium]